MTQKNEILKNSAIKKLKDNWQKWILWLSKLIWQIPGQGGQGRCCHFKEFWEFGTFLSKWGHKSQERVVSLVSGLSFGDVALTFWMLPFTKPTPNSFQPIDNSHKAKTLSWVDAPLLACRFCFISRHSLFIKDGRFGNCTSAPVFCNLLSLWNKVKALEAYLCRVSMCVWCILLWEVYLYQFHALLVYCYNRAW